MINLKKSDDETELEHHKRLVYGKLIDKTLTEFDYSELSKEIFGKEYSSDVARRMCYGSCKTLQLLDKQNVSNITDQDILDELEMKRFELEVERKKRNRINQEYHRNARNVSDKELTNEAILTAIEKLQPIVVKEKVHKAQSENGNIGVLFISDQHYGDEFVLKNSFGEIINEYSPQIFMDRMWKLLDDIESDAQFTNVSELKVISLGDTLSGILRATSALQQLKVGVVDGALEYAEFMSTWLEELSNRLCVAIDYIGVGGNHTALRLLSPKNNFPEEQMEKVINKYLSLRLKDNQNISIREYNDTQIVNVYGENILCYHGEDRDLEKALNFYRTYNKCEISYVYAGHLHSKSVSTAGMNDFGDVELVRVNSIVGGNDFSTKIKRISRAGAEFVTFNENGKQWQKTFYLN